jgi:hypothetical protein
MTYTRLIEVLTAEGITPADVLNAFGDDAARRAANLIPHPAVEGLRQRAARLWKAADEIRSGDSG